MPKIILSLLLAALLITFTTVVAQEAQPASAPGLKVPQTVIQEIDKLFQPPADKKLSREEMDKLRLENMKQVLHLGEKAEADYPQAENLYEVQVPMMYAADLLWRDEPGEYTEKLLTIAQKVKASKAPLDAQVEGDYILVREKLFGKDAENDPKKQAELINKMIAAYWKTESAVPAFRFAHLLALKANLSDLDKKILDYLQQNHPDDPLAQKVLREAGRSLPSRKTFDATLTTIDGKRLSLPEDLKGKVVLIDFWATWCGPCRASIPHVKEVYAKYKDQGLEIVAISLDTDKEQLEKYVKENNLEWIQTYSGKGWEDPTAEKYGIRGIPSVWLIGKDGSILSTNARGREEALIKKALLDSAPKEQDQEHAK